MNVKITQSMINTYAENFSGALCSVIGQDNFTELCKRTEANPPGNACYSHEYCDSNQVMLDVLGITDDDTDDLESYYPLINLIWDAAKSSNFYC